MRKKWLFLTLLAIILFGIGGLIVWKVSQRDNSVSQQPTTPPQPSPPGKLSQAELEKHLLEKRLDLQKYFVFNLGELTKEKAKPSSHEVWENGRKTNQFLSEHLTRIAEPYTSAWKKNIIIFVNNDFGQGVPEWRGEKLDKKIDTEKDTYVFFWKKSRY